jgi:hypothetical protein
MFLLNWRHVLKILASGPNGLIRKNESINRVEPLVAQILVCLSHQAASLRQTAEFLIISRKEEHERKEKNKS